jgi:peptidoglycan/xylan/chitin deacetylase (PgdA/CDA1 family)
MKAISLLYHDVIINKDYDSSGFSGPGAAIYKLEISKFKQHLNMIHKKTKNKPQLISESFPRTSGKVPLFFTFDDGGSSTYNYIADLLDQYGWKAHFFVTVANIGKPFFLTKKQIKDLRKRGHVVGTHSLNHPEKMSACSWDQLLIEWGESVRVLSEILGEEVTYASLPGGYYSKKIAKAASIVGIKVLFTSEPIKNAHYVDNCLLLGRYTIKRYTSPKVAAELSNGALFPCFSQFLFWNLKKIFKYFNSAYYSRIRNIFLKNI